MRVIWKYLIPVQDRFTLEIPGAFKDVQFLCVQPQGTALNPCLWVLVDPNGPKGSWLFAVRGTGHEFTELDEPTGTYVGTFQLADGKFVGHLFHFGRMS